MNKQRRVEFEEAIRKLRDIKDELVNLCDEEREAYDDLWSMGASVGLKLPPKSLRSCYDKSEAIDGELADLESVIINLEAIIND